MRSEDEIRKYLKENKDFYNKAFSDSTIPIEKYGQACGMEGFIDGLEWVLQEDNQ
jgi:uncharacterized protein with von Willebrand factor type A (vWA) domain